MDDQRFALSKTVSGLRRDDVLLRSAVDRTEGFLRAEGIHDRWELKKAIVIPAKAGIQRLCAKPNGSPLSRG